MPDLLNEHASAGSMTSAPTVDEMYLTYREALKKIIALRIQCGLAANDVANWAIAIAEEALQIEPIRRVSGTAVSTGTARARSNKENGDSPNART